ncbi:MAG TPA: hypothetical protein VHL57_07715, partial [Flavobacteriales bacterium]|nr:hypothetical protein [Flavobacteriales bacterium]
LKMQRLDVDGNALWDASGLVVSDEPQNSALFRYDLKSDHAGNAIVAFQDERSGALDIVAYRVAPDGSMLWGNGVQLTTPDGTGLAPVIGVLSDDRVVIAWNASPANNVAMRILPATGVPTAADPIQVQGTGRLGRPRIVPRSDGTFWLQYVQQTGNFLAPGTMLLSWYDATGGMVDGPLTLSTKMIASFHFPEPITDGADGLYIAFNTDNDANASLTDVFIQRVYADGTSWSATGTAVEVGATTQRYTGTATPALISEADGVMMAYRRTNTAQSMGGIAVQRMSTAGARLLGNTGVELIAQTDNLPEPFSNAAVDGGMVTAVSTGTDGQEGLVGLHVQPDGSFVGVGTIAICTTLSGKDDATLVPFRDGQAVAVWQDTRTASGIYAQPLEVDSHVGIAEVATEFELLGNPGSQPELVLGEEAIASKSILSILSIDGRLQERRTLPLLTSGQRLQLTQRPIPAGSYLVILEHDGTRQVLRWVHP